MSKQEKNNVSRRLANGSLTLYNTVLKEDTVSKGCSMDKG